MDSKTKKVLETLIGEGIGEGLDGMTAIAEVIRNRATMSKKDPYDVVSKPLQFSFWNNPITAQSFLQKYGNKDAYNLANQAWMASELSNLTGGGTHYHAKSIKKYPSWAKKIPKTTELKGHIFYREGK